MIRRFIDGEAAGVLIAIGGCVYLACDSKYVGAALFSTWFIAVGLGWLLGVHFGMGLVGLWIGMAADECFRGILFVFRFRAGRWQRYAKKAQA